MQKLLPILLALALSSPCATAATIRVPADRPTIQAAIDVAADGDTVLLADGSYGYEGNANIRVYGKSITICSENGPENCELYAYGWRYAFKLDRGEGRNTVIQGLTITGAGTGIYVKDSSPTIRNCVLNECGNGVLVVAENPYTYPHIDRTRFIDNQGDGIRINELGHALITDSEIRGNGFGWYGKGGVFINARSGAVIENCLIAENASTTNGGGINCEGSLTISNSTIVDNSAAENGGGLYSGDTSSTLTMENCIITGNSAQTGDQYALYSWEYLPSFYYISYTDVVGETYADPDCLELGEGMLDETPLFVSGPSGDRYLSQTAAGQGADSPCVDAGNPDSLMVFVTTRTDLIQDAGVVDMGYHYRNPDHDHLPDTMVLSGPGAYPDYEYVTSPVVSFSFTGTDEEYPTYTLTYSWRINDEPWSSWSPSTWATISSLDQSGSEIHFEVRARDPQGDTDPSPARHTFRLTNPVYLDYLDRIVVAPGPGYGNPPLVKTALGQWLAYGVAHYGVNVAAGDIDGDGTDEVVTGPGPGEVFGPHVRCFQPDGTVVPNAGFMAYGTHRFGVNVAAGDIDGDGNDEIITGAGPGDVFGPHVRGWNWDGGPSTVPIPGISFFAYGTLKYGVNVTCGDITGDGIDEIITGAGPGEMFGAHVRGWRFDGSSIAPMSDVSWLAFTPHKWGVKVACGDLDGDGYDEIITGIGPREGYGPLVRTWNYDNSAISLMPGIDFLAYPHGRYGVSVGATNVDGIGGDELLTMPGPGPMNRPWLRAWDVDEGTPELVYHGGFYDLPILDVWLTHGGNVAGSKNGWE